MRKTIGNAALIDARKLTFEAVKAVPEIKNAALVLVSEQSKELLMELRIGNVASMVCIPEEAALYKINGKGTLSVSTIIEKQVFILANGKLIVEHGVTPEAILKNVVGGIINGMLFCSLSQLAALQACGVEINGKLETYPDDCRMREGNHPITAMEVDILSEGEGLYLCKRTLLEKGTLDKLNERGVRLYGTGLMLYESEAQRIGTCWQGDPSCVYLVKDGYMVFVGKQHINRRNALTFRGMLNVIGDVIIDLDVEAQMLQALLNLRIEGELWVPLALMQQMMEKVDGNVEWMPYEGVLIRCEDILTLTKEMADNWPGQVTLYNSGLIEIDKDIELETLKKHIALIHNVGNITLTKAQHSVLQMMITGTGVIDEYQEKDEKRDNGSADEEETLGNIARLVL